MPEAQEPRLHTFIHPFLFLFLFLCSVRLQTFAEYAAKDDSTSKRAARSLSAEPRAPRLARAARPEDASPPGPRGRTEEHERDEGRAERAEDGSLPHGGHER